jgi:hypothetical protein
LITPEEALENERIYQKQKQEVLDEIASIQSGNHIEFVEKCKILREETTARLLAFEQFKRLQIIQIENSIDQEKKQAENDYTVRSYTFHL